MWVDGETFPAGGMPPGLPLGEAAREAGMEAESIEQGLDRLIGLAKSIAAGNYADVDELLDMAGDPDLPPKIAALAEVVGMLVVQVEAREFHLGCTIGDLERTQLELERANYDPLTGLPNRVIFHDRLRKAVAAAKDGCQGMAVMFVDLDRFKWVNDTLGHAAGDELLRQVAARMQGCVRGNDILARLGGDEFTVIMPAVRGERCAGEVAQRLLAALCAPFALEAGEARIGASIGIAVMPHHGDTPEELLERADAAMYRAKEAGRNTYHVYAA